MRTKSGRRIALAAVALTMPALFVVPAVPAGAARATSPDSARSSALPPVPRGAVPIGSLRAVAPGSRCASCCTLATPPRWRRSSRRPRSRRHRTTATTSHAASSQRASGRRAQTIAAVRAHLERTASTSPRLSASHLVLSVTGTAAQLRNRHCTQVSSRWRLASGTLGYRLDGARAAARDRRRRTSRASSASPRSSRSTRSPSASHHVARRRRCVPRSHRRLARPPSRRSTSSTARSPRPRRARPTA